MSARVKWRGAGPNRRAFLGGAAAVLALPWLPSLGGGARADATAPVRAVWWFAPNGMHMPAFTPTEVGASYTLSPILSPLAAMRDEVMVLSGLMANPDRTGVAPPHAVGTAGFLTGGVPKLDGVECATSVDQIAARKLGALTPFPSLQLGTEGARLPANCDVGFSCAYTTHLSWADPQSPMPQLTDPQQIFNRLFAGFDPNATDEERARRLAMRTSILDTVMDEASALRGDLGLVDSRRLDRFLTNVRELELRLLDLDAFGVCGDPDPLLGLATDLTAKIDRTSEITALALACDLTRLVTFALGNGGSLRSYEFLGVRGAHHDLSHHGGDPDKQAALQVIDTWEVERFAHLLARLREIDEGEGTLLDNSMVLFGSELSDGNAHGLMDLPVVLAGRGGGALLPGRHLRLQDRPLIDVHLTMLDALGVRLAPWGNGTGVVGELGA